jgi:hypothetical protein
MRDEVITSPDQVTAGWLTAVLTSSGALSAGAVAAVEFDNGHGNWSTNARLNVHYAAGSQGDMPRRLFLKMVDTGASSSVESFGPSEVTYYTRDYAGLANAPLLRCYHGAYSAEQQRYHLLLDDVSDTHVVAAEKDPTLGYGLALAEGLAVMHARWWGAPRLAEAGAPIHNAAHIRRFVAIAEPGVGHILNRFSAELKPLWPDLIHALYANHPQAIIARTKDGNGFTLIHGDTGQKNILVPRDAERPLYIIDRQPFNWSLTTWLGVYDLAYAMVLDWEVAARRRLEMPVLRKYREVLIANGVTGYSWERLVDDYRLSLAMGVYIASEYCRGGVNQRWISTYLQMLSRSLTACDDLNCSELW